MKKKVVDTAHYKGVRDFYPKDQFVQDYIFSIWHDVLQSFGYEHYSASVLEHIEIYENKSSSSDEIVSEQTYSFKDRGDRKITLRPEMTPTVSRMVAKKYKELSFPLRWYSIPNVFRYERPQKGRLREHWQLNVDVFGLDKIEAEAELIEIAYKIMRNFGLTEADFVVKINDRKILNEIANEYDLDEKKKKEFMLLLDRKNKIKDFNEQAEKILSKPFNLTIKPNDDLEKLTRILNGRGIKNVVFDPNMVRGFNYYTGPVFEIFDTDPDNNRALFGGGRYNGLLDMFGIENVSVVGFGMGDVALAEALNYRGLLPENVSSSHLYICNLSEESFDYSANLATELRSEGIDVTVDYSDRKVGDQVKYANKKGIPLVVCMGEEEMKSDRFKVKIMDSGKEDSVRRNSLAKFVKDKISG